MILLDKSGNGLAPQYIPISDNANFTPSGDFTIELFAVKFSSLAATSVLISHWNASSPFSNNRSWIVQMTTTALQIVLSNDGTSGGATTIGYTWSPTLGTEYNIAVDRSGSAVRIYVDGAMVQSGTKASALFNCTDILTIGCGRSGSSFAAFATATAKAVRFTNGVARYATNTSYTVPSLPLPTQ